MFVKNKWKAYLGLFLSQIPQLNAQSDSVAQEIKDIYPTGVKVTDQKPYRLIQHIEDDFAKQVIDNILYARSILISTPYSDRVVLGDSNGNIYGVIEPRNGFAQFDVQIGKSAFNSQAVLEETTPLMAVTKVGSDVYALEEIIYPAKQMQYTTKPFSIKVGMIDLGSNRDGDGFSDLEEALLGTNPNNSNNYFRVNLSNISSKSMYLDFHVVPNITYTIKNAMTNQTIHSVRFAGAGVVFYPVPHGLYYVVVDLKRLNE